MIDFTHKITVTWHKCKMPKTFLATSENDAIELQDFLEITSVLKTEKYQISKIEKAD